MKVLMQKPQWSNVLTGICLSVHREGTPVSGPRSGPMSFLRVPRSGHRTGVPLDWTRYPLDSTGVPFPRQDRGPPPPLEKTSHGQDTPRVVRLLRPSWRTFLYYNSSVEATLKQMVLIMFFHYCKYKISR